MKTLQKSQEKIKNICEVLRDEALEPAKKQAEEILQEAHREAESILAEAKKAASALMQDAKGKIEQERRVFQETLQQATQQSLEALRQRIESQFFNEHLKMRIEEQTRDPQIIARLISAVIEALNKDGVKADFSAIIPKKISVEEVNQFLKAEVLNFLAEESVISGSFNGGAKIKINDKKITIDISADTLKDLLSTYAVRKELRKLIFAK